LLVDRVAATHARFRRFSLYRSGDSQSWAIIIGFALLVWLSTRVRPDEFRLSQLVVPLWVAFVWTPLRFRFIEPVVGAIVIVLTATTSGFFGVGRWGDVGDTIGNEYAISRFDGLSIDDQVAADLDLIQSAWQQSNRSDTLFVANRSNEITGMSAPMVYYLLDADPAHWLTMFDPGFADQPEHQASMIESLCQSGAPVVLMETPRFKELEGLSFSKDLDRFIALNYDLETTTTNFDFRVPAADACIEPWDVRQATELQPRIDHLVRTGDSNSVSVLRSWQTHLE
jgi:hypothetical protein